MIGLKYPRLQILQNPARFKVLACGRRWGKTFLGLYFLHSGDLPPEEESWYIAPTYRQGKRIVWKRLKQLHREWGIDRVVDYSESDLSATFPGDHRLSIIGADNEDSLRGPALWRAVLDEYATMKPTVWGSVIRPMLSDHKAPAMFTGTPDGLNHFYELFQRGIDPGDQDWMGWQFKSIEHGYIDPDEVEAAKRDLDPRTFRQEYEASFETAGNRVYYAFNRATHGVCRNDVAQLIRQNFEIIIGMDFNVSKMCACIGVRIGKDEIHWFDELVLRDSNTFEMAQALASRFRGAAVYPDPAGSARKSSATKSDHQILREHGFRVIARRAHPPVKDRINAVNSRLMSEGGEARMTIDIDQCPELVNDLERMQWHNGEPDKRDPERSHMSDAMGYAVEYLYPINARGAQITDRRY